MERTQRMSSKGQRAAFIIWLMESAALCKWFQLLRCLDWSSLGPSGEPEELTRCMEMNRNWFKGKGGHSKYWSEAQGFIFESYSPQLLHSAVSTWDQSITVPRSAYNRWSVSLTGVNRPCFFSLHRHTVNILSALPLTCLDVLVSVHVDQASYRCEGVNMDCVHTLLLFLDRRLNRASKHTGVIT